MSQPAPYTPAPGAGGHGPAGGSEHGQHSVPERPTAPGFVTASMGRRLGARLLDGLVIGVPAAVLIGFFGAWAGLGQDANGDPQPAPIILLFVLAYLVLPLAVIAYEVLLIARGATLGKRWLGLRVVRRDTGAVPGLGGSALRYVIIFACSLVPLVGSVLVYVSPFFDSSGLRQGWHDLVAGTRVVDVRPELGGRSPGA